MAFYPHDTMACSEAMASGLMLCSRLITLVWPGLTHLKMKLRSPLKSA